MLDLTKQGREFLHSVHALGKDANGHEILLGLSFAESNFFICYQSDPQLGRFLGNIHKYRRLADRHLAARRINLPTKRH